MFLISLEITTVINYLINSNKYYCRELRLMIGYLETNYLVNQIPNYYLLKASVYVMGLSYHFATLKLNLDLWQLLVIIYNYFTVKLSKVIESLENYEFKYFS